MTFDSLKKFLHSTTARLAMTYLTIIMLMSIGFSIVFYNTSSNELTRQVPPRSLYGVDFIPNIFRPNVEGFIENRIVEGRHELLLRLIGLNLIALSAGAAISYALARRTLSPIEEAMEAQTQFVSDASHELKTPLTAIRTSNEVALRKPKLSLSDAKQVIQHNTDDVAKLQQLSDSLLSLANNKDLANLKVGPTALQEVASEAMNNVVQHAQAKKITVQDDLVNTHVLGNKQVLAQILTILLDNAIKYSESDSIVSLTSSEKGKFIYAHVRDQGIGIRASDLPHIFQRFYRVDQSRTKDQRDGYGLGLSIADKLIKQLHGEILVASTPGEGSTFTIKLPKA